jgi:hypothetical protein
VIVELKQKPPKKLRKRTVGDIPKLKVHLLNAQNLPSHVLAVSNINVITNYVTYDILDYRTGNQIISAKAEIMSRAPIGRKFLTDLGLRCVLNSLVKASVRAYKYILQIPLQNDDEKEVFTKRSIEEGMSGYIVPASIGINAIVSNEQSNIGE